LLAKIACKFDKPNGVTIWRPQDMPEPLFALPLSDISGVGPQIEKRLNLAGIHTTRELSNAQPKQLRALWRMWYALHGYDIHAMPTSRSIYGHGRVLPPKWRDAGHAMSSSRLFLTKAPRHMRRDRYYASKLWLWLASFAF
jgi:DNA polymerase IV